MRKTVRSKYRPEFPGDYHFDYKDPQTLARFISEGGKITPARISKLSLAQQKPDGMSVITSSFCVNHSTASVHFRNIMLFCELDLLCILLYYRISFWKNKFETGNYDTFPRIVFTCMKPMRACM